MKSKGMAYLGFAIIVLGGYAAYDYFGAEQKLKQKTEQSKLVLFPKDQITEVRIEKNGHVFYMKRDVDGWKILEPIQDWGDSESADIFLSTLETEMAKDIPREGDKIDWSVYGLDKPEAKITIKSSTNETMVYQVSAQKNYEQNTFLKRNDEQKVFVVSSTWQARADKGVAELRDLRLLRHKMASISEVHFKNPTGSLHLKQKDGRWIRAEFPDKKIDQNRVYTLLQSIADTRAGKIILERAPTTKEKFDYFLDKPMAELKLQLGDRLWTAYFGQGGKELFALINDPLFLLEIDTGNVDKFFKVKPDDFFEQEKK